jgi:hypothetical protein
MVGRYPVDAVLGSGSFGTVYRGRDPRTGNLVAVKVLDSRDGQLLAKVDAEAAALLSVDDEHCVRVIDIVRAPERAALVTDYVEGASLRAVLARAGRLTGPQALDVIRGALLGLIAVHENGLVHGDVKPDNILVDRRGRSRLIDFGLAHAPGNAPGHAWPGSPAYMSPEQVRGDPVDARADIYACAAVLFELLTGVRPFTGPDARAVMRAHVDEPVPDPRSFEPSLSDELARVCRRGLAKHPGERYATAREFLAELEDAARRRYGAAWMSGLGIGSLVGAILATRAGDTATPAPPERTRAVRQRVVRRPRGRVVAVGAVGVAALVTAVLLIVGRSSPPAPAEAQARPIVYEVDRGQVPVFGLVEPTGSGARLLPPLNRLCCFAMSLSPDGRRLAVTEEGALYVAAADGTGARLLHGWPTVSPGAVAWSPDGRRIAFSTGSAIDVITTAGTGLHRLATGTDIEALAWSPTGDRLAFHEKGRAEIGGVAANGGPVSTLYGPAQGEPAGLVPTTLSWAPGRSILFGTAARRGIWSYSVGAAPATRVLAGADQPSWGPDGRSFAALLGRRIVIDVPGRPHGSPFGPSGILSISWG